MHSGQRVIVSPYTLTGKRSDPRVISKRGGYTRHGYPRENALDSILRRRFLTIALIFPDCPNGLRIDARVIVERYPSGPPFVLGGGAD